MRDLEQRMAERSRRERGCLLLAAALGVPLLHVIVGGVLIEEVIFPGACGAATFGVFLFFVLAPAFAEFVILAWLGARTLMRRPRGPDPGPGDGTGA